MYLKFPQTDAAINIMPMHDGRIKFKTCWWDENEYELGVDASRVLVEHLAETLPQYLPKKPLPPMTWNEAAAAMLAGKRVRRRSWTTLEDKEGVTLLGEMGPIVYVHDGEAVHVRRDHLEATDWEIVPT